MDPITIAEEAVRPLANYHPDIWSDTFSNYIPLDEDTQKKMEQEVNDLKEKLRKELMTAVKDPKERLVLIDSIQRLGVAYHYEEEIIEANLKKVLTINVDDFLKDDLHYTSIRFRLLRQHGFRESCDVFDKFMDKNGSFKECLASDLQGILNLYEASHLRLHGESVLDEALAFTKTHLTSLASRSNSPLAKHILHALERPIYKTSIRAETKHQIAFYESNASFHETLLRLAKLDFNLLQLVHKKELSDLIRWSESMDFKGKFPYARDRMVEPYIWTLGVYYEPKYTFARTILNKVFKLITIIDDMYDAYGFIEELELFTDAILRWDINCLIQLPDYMKLVYKTVLDMFQGFEEDLANEGMSLYTLEYLQEELKVSCQAYLVEARWCHEKYVPTLDEYMKNATVSSVYHLMLMATYQGMGNVVTKEAIEWIQHNNKALKASCVIARLEDDLAGHKFEQKRNHVVSAVECFMANFNVSEEQTYIELQHQIEEAWMDLTAEMFRPTSVPMTLLTQIRNMSTAIYDAYQIGADGFTVVESMKPKIEQLFIEPAV